MVRFICVISSLFFSITAQAAKENSNHPKVIAVTQIISHPSLDKIRRGIVDSLRDSGFEEGKNLTIVFDNAQGSVATATQIAHKFRGISPDVAVGIATPSAQALASVFQGTSTPVVFAAVTDPKTAGLAPDHLEGKVLITGTTDFPPVDQQIALIRKMCPERRRIGVLYSVGEINAKKQVQSLKNLLKPGETLIEIPIQSSAEILFALRHHLPLVDVIHIPLDNMIVANLPSVVHVAHAHKVPVFTSHPEGVLEVGALGTVGIDQYQSGYETGKLVSQILQGVSVKKIPVLFLKKAETHINRKIAKNFGARLPENTGECP